MKKKIAPTILFLFKDPDNFSTSIADALHPFPNSSFTRLEETFELPLDRYGIKDQKACGDLLHFVDNTGNYKVSMLLLEKYEPPILVCAINEVLNHVIGEWSSVLPTLVVPFIGPSAKLKMENKSLSTNGRKTSLYGIQIGPETETTKAVATRTQKPPSSLQVQYEPLACLLQLVRALKLPASFLIGHRGRGLTNKAFAEDLEILYEMGDLLENVTNLCFSREKITWNSVKTSRETQEPWRALYG